MRKITLLVAAAALALPAAAFATKPPHPAQAQNAGKPAQAQAKTPKVMYVLRGTLTAYTAASGTANGSVSLAVAGANHHGAALKKTTVTFAVSAATKVALHDGAAIAVGDRAVVKVRGPKKLDATALQAVVAQQLIDQGAPKTS